MARLLCGSILSTFRLTAAKHSQEIPLSAAPSMIWICEPLQSVYGSELN
jgi:hypothetical protein